MGLKSGAKVLLFFDMTKFLSKKLQNYHHLSVFCQIE